MLFTSNPIEVIFSLCRTQILTGTSGLKWLVTSPLYLEQHPSSVTKKHHLGPVLLVQSSCISWDLAFIFQSAFRNCWSLRSSCLSEWNILEVTNCALHGLSFSPNKAVTASIGITVLWWCMRRPRAIKHWPLRVAEVVYYLLCLSCNWLRSRNWQLRSNWQ